MKVTQQQKKDSSLAAATLHAVRATILPVRAKQLHREVTFLL